MWQLRASSGRLIARSHGAPDEPWPAIPLVEGHQRAGGLAVYTIPGQDRWLQVAQPLAELRRAQYTAASAAGGTVLALGLLASAVLGWAIRQELRPIADFSRAVESIGPETVRMLPPALPRSELGGHTVELDAMLARLHAKLRSERAFAAHAAHSLRTPLAGLSAQLEVASAAAPPDVAQRLGLASAAAQRLTSVVEALLSMTRTTEARDGAGSMQRSSRPLRRAVRSRSMQPSWSAPGGSLATPTCWQLRSRIWSTTRPATARAASASRRTAMPICRRSRSRTTVRASPGSTGAPGKRLAALRAVGGDRFGTWPRPHPRGFGRAGPQRPPVPASGHGRRAGIPRSARMAGGGIFRVEGSYRRLARSHAAAPKAAPPAQFSVA